MTLPDLINYEGQPLFYDPNREYNPEEAKCIKLNGGAHQLTVGECAEGDIPERVYVPLELTGAYQEQKEGGFMNLTVNLSMEKDIRYRKQIAPVYDTPEKIKQILVINEHNPETHSFCSEDEYKFWIQQTGEWLTNQKKLAIVQAYQRNLKKTETTEGETKSGETSPSSEDTGKPGRTRRKRRVRRTRHAPDDATSVPSGSSWEQHKIAEYNKDMATEEVIKSSNLEGILSKYHEYFLRRGEELKQIAIQIPSLESVWKAVQTYFSLNDESRITATFEGVKLPPFHKVSLNSLNNPIDEYDRAIRELLPRPKLLEKEENYPPGPEESNRLICSLIHLLLAHPTVANFSDSPAPNFFDTTTKIDPSYYRYGPLGFRFSQAKEYPWTYHWQKIYQSHGLFLGPQPICILKGGSLEGKNLFLTVDWVPILSPNSPLRSIGSSGVEPWTDLFQYLAVTLASLEKQKGQNITFHLSPLPLEKIQFRDHVPVLINNFGHGLKYYSTNGTTDCKYNGLFAPRESYYLFLHTLDSWIFHSMKNSLPEDIQTIIIQDILSAGRAIWVHGYLSPLKEVTAGLNKMWKQQKISLGIINQWLEPEPEPLPDDITWAILTDLYQRKANLWNSIQDRHFPRHVLILKLLREFHLNPSLDQTDNIKAFLKLYQPLCEDLFLLN